MTTEPAFTLEQFTSYGWQYDTSPEEQYGYSTVMQSFIAHCMRHSIQYANKAKIN